MSLHPFAKSVPRRGPAAPCERAPPLRRRVNPVPRGAARQPTRHTLFPKEPWKNLLTTSRRRAMLNAINSKDAVGLARGVFIFLFRKGVLQ